MPAAAGGRRSSSTIKQTAATSSRLNSAVVVPDPRPLVLQSILQSTPDDLPSRADQLLDDQDPIRYWVIDREALASFIQWYNPSIPRIGNESEWERALDRSSGKFSLEREREIVRLISLKVVQRLRKVESKSYERAKGKCTNVHAFFVFRSLQH